MDVHVHLREPGATHKEDFGTGTCAAVAGGYTQILDMPNNVSPTTTPARLQEKIRLTRGKIWCDVGFNFGASARSTKYFNQVKKQVFGLKVYMNQTTGPLLVNKDKDREMIFKIWDSPLPIMVHAEDETINDAIKLAKKYQKALHVCHATYYQLKPIDQARRYGLKISCEVTPHHLFLTADDAKKLGPLGVMKPLLRSKSDQKKLWENLDKVDMISTDHAPHTLEEKYDKSSPKFGVPGLETTLHLMLAAVDKGLLSIERVIEMTSVNPRKIFRLPPQADTFVTVDVNKRFKISNDGLFTKCGWTPFVGLEGRGEVKKVVMRGKTVFENGKFIGKPQGKAIYPGRNRPISQ